MYCDPTLFPCEGCGERKVLFSGEYCVQCALKWEPNRNYIVVKPDSLDYAEKRSDVTREYLQAKSEQAFERYCSYVIFFADGKWGEIMIEDRFHIPTVMKNLLNKLERHDRTDLPGH